MGPHAQGGRAGSVNDERRGLGPEGDGGPRSLSAEAVLADRGQGASSLHVKVKEFEMAEIPLGRIWRNGRIDMYPTLEGKGYFSVRLGRGAVKIQGGSHV